MNTKQAKQISIEKLLNLLSHALAKEIRGELWYYSPFRTEKEPSFKVNPEKNIWYDFGEGLGGNVLYFIMRFYNIADVSFALLKLSEILGIEGEQSEAIIISPRQSKVSQISVKRQKIDRIQSLENRSLIQYLRKRGISKETAAPYVKEKNSVAQKKYFALAFPSLSGGYELRNPYFKGAIGKKDISMVKRKKEQKEDIMVQTAVTIFEGFMDFLSALTYFRVLQAKTKVIVLNSVSLKHRACQKVSLTDA